MNRKQQKALTKRAARGPLRKIVSRGVGMEPVETLECGHTVRPKPHPAYPERHLEAKSRRCTECAA